MAAMAAHQCHRRHLKWLGGTSLTINICVIGRGRKERHRRALAQAMFCIIFLSDILFVGLIKGCVLLYERRDKVKEIIYMSH